MALSVCEVQELFTHEVCQMGGEIHDRFLRRDPLPLMISRGLLSNEGEVDEGDVMHAGVAIRSDLASVEVVSFLYRRVCANGQLMHETTGVNEINLSSLSDEEAASKIESAISAAAQPEVFQQNLADVRSLIQSDTMLTALDLLHWIQELGNLQLVRPMMHILAKQLGHGNLSSQLESYELMNDITATARDIEDPDLRWQMERLGGGVVALLKAPPRQRESPRRLQLGPRLQAEDSNAVQLEEEVVTG